MCNAKVLNIRLWTVALMDGMEKDAGTSSSYTVVVTILYITVKADCTNGRILFFHLLSGVKGFPGVVPLSIASVDDNNNISNSLNFVF